MSNEKDKALADANDDKEEKTEKPVKKTQGQLMQEALGLDQDAISAIEKELFVTKFLDTASEDIFDFIYRERILEKYLEMVKKNLNEASKGEKWSVKEEFEKQQIESTLLKLKAQAEKIAQENDITTSIHSKIRRSGLITTIPLIAIMVLMFIPALADYSLYFMLPVCVLCFLPQLLRSRIVQKWNAFKEENKKYFYQENREEILRIKDYIQVALDDIRSTLLDKKVPLQIIKFSLSSSDYKNVKLLNEYTTRGVTQYFFTFEYPPGVEPFPIPELIKKVYTAPSEVPNERDHFLVLKNIVIVNEEIEKFEVELKDDLKEDINNLLNACEFEKGKDFSLIMPNYTPETAIHCVCGEIAEFSNVQRCSWKDKETEETFEFYLFESDKCKCGEKVYVLSPMEEKAKISGKWIKIFD